MIDFNNKLFGFDIYNYPSYIINDIINIPEKKESKILELTLQRDSGVDSFNYVPLIYYKYMLQKMQLMQQLYSSEEYREKTEDEIKVDLQEKLKKKYLKYKIKYLELKKNIKIY